MATQTIITPFNPPADWVNQPNVVLSGVSLRASSVTYSAQVTINGANGFQKQFNVSNNSYYAYENIGWTRVPANAFPLSIEHVITSSSSTNVIAAAQQPIALKPEGGNPEEVICYQTGVFCNDGSDNDYNDFVINWQAFNQSAD